MSDRKNCTECNPHGYPNPIKQLVAISKAAAIVGVWGLYLAVGAIHFWRVGG